MATRPLKFPLVLGLNIIHATDNVFGAHFAFQVREGRQQPTLWLTVAGGKQKEYEIFVGVTGEALPGRSQEHLGSALTINTGFVAHCYRIEE